MVLAVALTGCAVGDDLADQYRSGDKKGFIAGDSRIVEYPPSERGEPVQFVGLSERGEPVSSDDYLGRVYVVNFWFAGCAPCRAEAPLLERVWQDAKSDDVGFVGVNTFDQAPTALSFADDFGVTYPSVLDAKEGAVRLAFASVVPLRATPSTVVVDADGKVAARIVGPVQSVSILSTLIEDAAADVG